MDAAITVEGDGRFHWAAVEAAQVQLAAPALEELFARELDVLTIRGAFPAAVMDAVVERLGHEDPRVPRVDQGQIILVGMPLTPNYADNEGPSLDSYLATAEHFRSGLGALFGGFDFEARLRELLVPLTGGKPLEVVTGPGGRPYTPATIRGLPPGARIVDHYESEFLEKAAYRHLLTVLDTSEQISFVIPLAVPDGGGELVLYHRRWEEERHDDHADRARLERRAFNPRVGDLIIFAGGRHLHGVTTIEGTRARWTIGGFLGPSPDHTRWLYFS